MQSQEKTRRARERIAMSYDFEDVLKRLKAKRDAVAERSEEENVARLRTVLDDTVDRCSVRLSGNHVTDAGFIAEELDISTPSTIGDCSEKLYAGLTRLEGELDLFESIAATVDLDPDDARHLTVDLALKERSKLTASIGATHDTHLSSVNGNTSVGIRNMFGRGERLDVAADMGMATTNEFNMRTAVYNVSNQYSVTFTKPRLLLPYYLDPQVLSDCVLAAAQSPDGAVRGRHNRVLGPSQKYTSTLRFFNQKLDRSRMSSYSEDCIGLTATMLSATKNHSLSLNYHLRALTPVPMTASGMVSGSIADEQMPSVKSSVEYRFARDTRNHAAVPSTGYVAAIDAELAGFPASDSDFFKLFASCNYHFSLLRNAAAIVNVGFAAGFVAPWKRALSRAVAKYSGSDQVDDSRLRGDRSVRIIDRLLPFAGLRCRGFETGQIGPKDGNDYIHCDALAAFGLSVTVPLTEWLYAHFFANSVYSALMYAFTQRQVGTGSALRSDSGAQDASTVSSVGASVVVPFPVGRMEIGYAYPFFQGNATDKTHRFSPIFWNFDVNFF